MNCEKCKHHQTEGESWCDLYRDEWYLHQPCDIKFLGKYHIENYDYRGQPLCDRIICGNCGEDLEDFEKICPHCGAEMYDYSEVL